MCVCARARVSVCVRVCEIESERVDALGAVEIAIQSCIAILSYILNDRE